jgi:septal ring factor EnvC (AmiA/AmiB activator)
LFPEAKPYHSSFQLFDAASQLRLTDDLAIQVIELPKFMKALDELEMPLDLWLYFLKNGAGLDADNLPAKLDTAEIRLAMRILKMLSQNEIERELYEGRLKAKRDMQTMETLARQYRQSAETAERRREAAERELEAAEREREAIQRDKDAIQRDNDAIQRDNDAIQRELRRELADRVRFCQRLLRQPLSDVDDLLALNDWDLRERVKNLEQDVTAGIDPA